MSLIERFVCLLYHPSSSKTDVNECRRQLFVKHSRQLEGLPPTKAALYQHTLRAAYQAGYVWYQALSPIQILLSPEEWGWTKTDGSFQPKWSTLPSVSEACQELTSCYCKLEKGCKGRCFCKKIGLPCTELCKCNGDCI